MELTKEQFDSAISNLANKEDLKGFAKRDDFKNFATKADMTGFAKKDDLKSFATKDDLLGLAKKNDLKNFATKDDLAGLATSTQLKGIKLDLEELKELITKIDNRDLEDSNAFRSIVLGHGVSITRLEKKVGIKVLARSEH